MSDLNLKRGNIKRALTRFTTYVDSLQGQDISDQIYHELRCRVEKIECIYDQFNDIQDEIEATLGESETDLAAQSKERDTFETKFYSYLGQAKSILSNFSDNSSKSSVIFRNSGQVLADTQTQNNQTRDIHQVKFPAIKLPSFNGEYSKFLEFRDAFSALVHDNKNMSNIEKFYYLKSSLQDEALEVIQSLEVTSLNYPIAWQLVIERFENNKLIILNHVKAIFEFSKLEKECHSGLRKLHDTLQKNLRALKSLNQPTEHWDTLIIYIASSKLDQTSRRDWEAYKIQGDIPTMTDFNNFLKGKCEVLEKIEYNLKEQFSRERLRRNTNVKLAYSNYKLECFFCKGNHSVYKCDKLLKMQIYSRIREVKNKNLCLNCLKPGHINTECTTSRCRTCDQLHNTLLHINSSNQVASNLTELSQTNKENVSFDQVSNNYSQEQVFQVNNDISQVRSSQDTSQFFSQSQVKSSQGQVMSNQGTSKLLVQGQVQVDQGQVGKCQVGQIQASRVSSGQVEGQINNSSQAFKNSESCYSHSHAMASTNQDSSQVLLATALVFVQDNKGLFHKARVLLDNGSQSNFITKELCNKLGLQEEKVNFSVKGIGQSLSHISRQVKVSLKSCNSAFQKNISCLVIPAITDAMPLSSFKADELNIPPNIKLADPYFNKSERIDILLGSSIFWNLLSIGQISLGVNKPILQKTLLGWIVSGTIYFQANQGNSIQTAGFSEVHCFHLQCEFNINDQLSKFWQIEECQDIKPVLTESERYCESHFTKNLQKNSEGRFVVRMPLKESCQLGESKEMALKRFLSLEYKLNKNSKLKTQYLEFMQDYEELGHMTKVFHQDDQESKISYYIPHHAVTRECSLTTKIRVVFDASAKSSNGFSLNDIQYSGPTIQSDLFSILLRFRQYPFVLSADISKMYRQVLIANDQRCLQKILWRKNPNDEIQVYQLNTVTYGTASAPFLAVRCLVQLAEENKDIFPQASNVIKNDFYCDDLLTSCNSVEDIINLQRDISKILSSGGFILRKWLTNKPELISKFTVSNDLDFGVLQLGPDESNKTLGVLWNSNVDILQYSISDSLSHKVTKRVILSIASQIFDPMGLLGPVIIKSKLILQKLWQSGISWDEAIPQNIYSEWIQFQDDLKILNSVKIPRYALSENAVIIELHGFCDSSELAYGACIYIHCSDKFGFQSCHLLCAKSRVAPLKQISLPRLELCGANLLAHLANKVVKSLTINISKRYFWSDSTITLGWIKSSARNWKTFVANRVGDIQSLTDPSEWYHVKSCENPADLISRGVSSSDLLNSELWWHGPQWLSKDKSCWDLSIKYSKIEPLPEQRSQNNTKLCHSVVQVDLDIISKFSSLSKLQRVVALCIRFIKNSRSSKEQRQIGCLTSEELNYALHSLVKFSQIQSFPSEYTNLIQGKSVKKNSRLSNLNVFMDKENIIRVGGRLNNSEYSYNKKHPMLLSSSHRLTYLLFVNEHNSLLHCGPQQLLASIRERFWPLAGRSLARKVVKQCITCFKVKPTPESYKMGDLPQVRVKSFQPFLNVGIDFAGPILIKDRKLRNAKLIKAYIVVFVCMSTKCMHLDLVTDLTTDAFVAVLKRFIYRRGKPSNIYTDNGTTFVGANSQLQELYHFLQTNNSQISDLLTNDGITWHFIPPRSPNFGGLWEAGVKSVKYHLKRAVGNLNLTYENMLTVLVQIEGILNSRPLTPFSSDPSDFTPLSPAHFLIGKPITSIPEKGLSSVQANRLNLFQQQQQVIQMFWNRWHREYISELQSRLKWKHDAVSMLKVGSLVLIKDENLPVLQWQLGRVTNIYPGRDNIVRVASVRLPSGSEVKRALSKLCVLPIKDSD